ncbi:MAG: mechanosensitive ion channel [Burkholderiaceae bacterium]|nr:mechanosensitive ion channel [Burkholderiaceae bacterium]
MTELVRFRARLTRACSLWLLAVFATGLLALWPDTSAHAEPRGAAPATARSSLYAPEDLVLFNRPVIELRGTLGGLNPKQRVSRASDAFYSLSNEALEQPVAMLPMSLAEGSGYTFMVAEKPVFTLLTTDLDPEARLTLLDAADIARANLQDAVIARRAQGTPGAILRGLSTLLGVAAILGVALWGTLKLFGALSLRAIELQKNPSPLSYVRVLSIRLASLLVWLGMGVLIYLGAVVLLDGFPYTQPWGSELAGFVGGIAGWLVTGVIGAIPGLVTVAVIMVIARSVQDVLGMFLKNVQEEVIRVPFMHAETVSATRRLMTIFVYGLAVAIAYPYLPGSNTDAFKGLSVLFGLMVTMGSSSLMTQLMSGLVVVYSRSLKKGDLILVNDIEGVVTEVGALAVKVTTVRNEEITVPNAVITSSPIHNYSRLSQSQGTLISTTITIGYDTPWRQVHAMLTQAANRTEGIRADPAPHVFQRALSDFYVEYELFAYIDVPRQRPTILSRLLAQIQDEFNSCGVQIMSPHFVTQPEQAVFVPKEHWHDAPAGGGPATSSK